MKKIMTKIRGTMRQVGLLTILTVLVFTQLAFPSDVFWDGGGSNSLWHDPLNWSTDAVPDSSDHITINVTSFIVAEFAVNNDGIIDVQSGEVRFYGGGTSTGTFNAAPGGLINFAGGTYTFNTGTTFTGTGSNQVTGTVILNGTLTSQNLALGGTMMGTGTITGTFTWRSGTMSGPGALTIPAGSTMNFGGALFGGALDGYTLNNAGTVTLTTPYGLGLAILVTNGAIFNNQPTGTFDVQGSGGANFEYTGVGTTPAFNNAGTFKSQAETFFAGIPFNNTGTVDVQNGRLYFITGDYTQAAGTTRIRGGRLDATNTINIQGGTLEGGTILANVSNAGQVNPAGTSPGSLYITGNYTQTATGSLNVELEHPLNAFDQLNISGIATLNGTLNISLINGFVPKIGDSYQIITYGSRNGTFATVTGSGLFDVIYNPTNVTLVTVRTAGVTISETGNSTDVTEDGATDTYTVVLQSQPASDVTITVTPDAQVSVSPNTLTFTPANWNVAQMVTVTAVDDAIAEGAHTGTITHSATSADATYNGIAIVSVTANIQDNDAIIDVTAMSQLNQSGMRFNRRTGQSSLRTTWKNIGAESFLVPLQMVIESITPPTVTPDNPDGTTPEGKPFYDYSNLAGDGKLDPGETSGAKQLIFNNPNRARFEFNVSFWAKVGGGGAAPPLKPLIGQPQRIDIFIPVVSALEQNFPNPFNPETWIPYTLAKASDVTISIYDIRGRLVRTLELGHREIGQYFTQEKAAYWDGKNQVGEPVGSGVYLYKLEAGDFSAVRKMVVVK
ncbi:T9SS type A sorting domain-containing protein [Candidatus Poribacteria bacterium]|nr:T9SS type A sorting domain-containing protein [Candidatus Poribacteria bacterium]